MLDTKLFEEYWAVTRSRVFRAFTSGVLFGTTSNPWSSSIDDFILVVFEHRNHALASLHSGILDLPSGEWHAPLARSGVMCDGSTSNSPTGHRDRARRSEFSCCSSHGGELAASEAIRQTVTTYLVFNLALVINNMVTDSIFGHNIYIVVVPILSLLASSAMGFLTSYEIDDPHIYIDIRIGFGFMLLTNVLLLALTAGRIWWIRRDLAGASEFSIVRTYDNVIAIMPFTVVAAGHPNIPGSHDAGDEYCPDVNHSSCGFGLNIDNKTNSGQRRTTSQPFNIRPPGGVEHSTQSILSGSMIQCAGRERAEP
ncbi:hypothetical protein C8R45DRAFT_1135479 [Mycena sanguinolenta]|nr:hypothetical protein C8R45DRAFT_1135479 [Mycena sanguinolenta]